MNRLFSMSFFVGSLALAALSAQAGEPELFAVSEIPGVPAVAESASDDPSSQFYGKQTSFTSSLAEPPACGVGKCGASQGCDGGWSDSVGGCPLFSDEPLLGFLKNQPIGDCWTISVGGELRYRFMDETDRLRPTSGRPNSSTYDLWRFTPHVELKRGDEFTAYVEAIDASIFNEELPVTSIDKNRSDQLQVYGDFKIAGGEDGTLRGRVGRQRGREVSLLNLQYFGEEQIVPSGALPLSFQAVSGGMVL
ncbi:MAG: alginate export family protein [Planctomycetales bacterium]|jgi:hypothetical protein